VISLAILIPMTHIIEFIEYITVPTVAFLLVAVPLLKWAKREMWD
jgi:hypothetical protein